MKNIKREKALSYLRELDNEFAEQTVLLDGLDDAIVGVIIHKFGYKLVYDYHKIIEKLMEDGMSVNDAHEYFTYNIENAYMGEFTPVYQIYKI